MIAAGIAKKLRVDARTADELHEKSRALLVGAVRRGAAAGLSQREIALAIGRSQPEVSRLLRFHGSSDLAHRLMRNRKAIIVLAGSYNVANLRVFGSVARGTDRPDSDIDLLVDLPTDMGLFTLARLERDLAELLGASVDVVPAQDLKPHLRESALRDAIAL